MVLSCVQQGAEDYLLKLRTKFKMDMPSYSFEQLARLFFSQPVRTERVFEKFQAIFYGN